MRSRRTIKITEETTTTVIRLSHLDVCLCPVCVRHRNAPIVTSSSTDTDSAETGRSDGSLIEKQSELIDHMTHT
jgi:hypothetical protein